MPNAVRSRAASAALLVLVAACAFGDRQARLVYPPKLTAGLAPPAARDDAPAIALLPPADERPEPRRTVGWVRNGFHMHTADVITADDVPAWVAGALRAELERRGMRLVEVAPGSSAPALGAQILRVHCDAYFSYQGEVVLRAWITAGGAPLLDQVYTGKSSSGTNWAATAESYAECLAVALQDAAARVAIDVKRLAEGPPRPAVPGS